MIKGTGELSGMFDTLRKLEFVVGIPVLSSDVFDYVIRYGGEHVHMWDSHDSSVDEYDKPTDEELEVLAWFDDRYIDEIILEEEDVG